ncbi:MAG TPA: crosslink repair DNA glycosylase YcaQ family protein [Candidatus Nanopelagicales bacterium]
MARPTSPAPLSLSADDVRVIALRAQGLLGSPYPVAGASAARAGLVRRTAAVDAVLRHLGAVQLDTISVLARNHELVPYARLGAVGRDAVEAAYWGNGRDRDHPGPVRSFEYWSHAACILPVEEWPWFAFRRRSYQRLGVRWHEVPRGALDVVRGRLRDDGPLTTADLGGGRAGGEWWDWSEAKIAVEWLLDIGEVVCTRRVGWRRVYDLADRAIPAELRESVVDPTDADCVRELLARSARVLGVGTVRDLTDVHRLGTRHVPREQLLAELAALVDAGRLVPVQVQDWRDQAYADVDALRAGTAALRSRTTLLSPFDSLVWDRARTSRVFGFDHTLEAYVPAARRVHGYFTMPVLHGGRLVARLDPKRDGDVLRARQVSFEVGPRGGVPAAAVAGTAKALRDAAGWVGAGSVHIDPARVRPAGVAAALVRACADSPADAARTGPTP